MNLLPLLHYSLLSLGLSALLLLVITSNRARALTGVAFVTVLDEDAIDVLKTDIRSLRVEEVDDRNERELHVGQYYDNHHRDSILSLHR